MNPIQLQENLTALIVKVDGLMAEYESQKLVYELGDQEASDSNYVERLIQDGFLYFDRHLFRYLRVYPYVLAEGVLTTYIAGLLQSKGGNNTMNLIQITDWIEDQALQDDPDLENWVVTGVLEGLVTSHCKYLPQLTPYLGRRTKELAKLSSVDYTNSEWVHNVIDGRPYRDWPNMT